MAKITPLSDIHLEFSFFDIRNTQNADFLVLSGDILIAEDLHDCPRTTDTSNIFYRSSQQRLRADTYRKFLQQASQEFEHVIYIAGNHEFYYGKWYTALDYLREECKEYGIHFLECNSVNFEEHQLTFIGGTLWTDMNNRDPITMHSIKSIMNDYNFIRNDRDNYRRIDPLDTVKRHQETVKYIEHSIKASKSIHPTHKIIVVGHHGPTWASVPAQYKQQTISNGAYVSDLSQVILDHPEIVLWTAGHTHEAYQYTIGSTKVVCNPRGYQSAEHNEVTGWDPHLIIDV